MPRLATHVHTSSTTIVVSQGAESPIDPSVAWGYPIGHRAGRRTRWPGHGRHVHRDLTGCRQVSLVRGGPPRVVRP